MEEKSLVLEGKGEVVGNLVAGRLTGGGVGFFYFGEYFEAQPLIEIADPEVSPKRQWWVDGVSYGVILAESLELKEKLAAYGDTLVYTLSNPSSSKVRLRLTGGIQAFNRFNPDFRRKIAQLAAVRFEYSRGYLRGVYGGGYWLCLGSDRGLRVEVESDQATYEVEPELDAGGSIIFAVAGASSETEAKRRVEGALADPSKIEEDRKRQVESMLEKIPRLSGTKPRYEQLWKFMWYVILSNRVSIWGHPVLTNPFKMPSKFEFRHQWLWDSAFHAIVLAEYNVGMAEEELLNLFAAHKPDGRIPHEVFLSKEFCSLSWKVDGYSPWTTQPPVLGIAVKRIIGTPTRISLWLT